MGKESKSIREPVELPALQLRPSRIRRDPPPNSASAKPDKLRTGYASERDAWTVAIGVVLFAAALAIIIVGFSDFTSR